MSGKAVAEKVDQLPSTEVLDDLVSFEGEGLDYDTSELQIPFVRIIQALSPQIKKSDSAYIQGASMGDLFNTVTNQYWSGEEGVTVIPCYQETKYLKFGPRTQGGGFLGELAKDDPQITQARREGGKEILPDGNELVKSDQHYCLILDEDGVPGFGIIDMKSTQLKISRRWKTMAKMLSVKHPKTGQLVSPPIFGSMWKLKTVEESNDMGSWFNYTIERVGYVNNKELLDAAVAFRNSITSGQAKAVAEDLVGEEHNNTEDAPF